MMKYSHYRYQIMLQFRGYDHPKTPP